MTDKEFVQLQTLISKLQDTVHHASKVDQTFKRYHFTSVELLNNLPDQLNNLRNGINVTQQAFKKSVNKSKSKES